MSQLRAEVTVIETDHGRALTDALASVASVLSTDLDGALVAMREHQNDFALATVSFSFG